MLISLESFLVKDMIHTVLLSLLEELQRDTRMKRI